MRVPVKEESEGKKILFFQKQSTGKSENESINLYFKLANSIALTAPLDAPLVMRQNEEAVPLPHHLSRKENQNAEYSQTTQTTHTTNRTDTTDKQRQQRQHKDNKDNTKHKDNKYTQMGAISMGPQGWLHG